MVEEAALEKILICDDWGRCVEENIDLCGLGAVQKKMLVLLAGESGQEKILISDGRGGWTRENVDV